MHVSFTDTATPIAAFVAGVIASVHCAGMCGPLTCAMFGRCGKGETLRATGTYQAARIAAYSLLGGLLDIIGYPAARLFTSSPAKLMPWAFGLVFVALAFGLEKRVPQPAFLSRVLLKLRFGSKGRLQLAALLGLATPFLPCGPLYLMLGLALISGSFLTGALLMASFALGTLPLYWLVQAQWFQFQTRFSPRGVQWTRRGLACASAGLLIWRAVANGGLGLAQTLCH